MLNIRPFTEYIVEPNRQVEKELSNRMKPNNSNSQKQMNSSGSNNGNNRSNSNKQGDISQLINNIISSVKLTLVSALRNFS